ncbi:hypothetical protein HDU77_007762 [Chytriomyces hyalinus]|nr:hypothetical protein HDU77_007762 [Chytriomyces hyalinus]
MSVKQCCVSVKTAAVAEDGTTWVNMTLSDWSLSNDPLVVVFPPTVVFSRDPNAIAVGVAATSDPTGNETEIPGVCTGELRTGRFTCVGGLRRVAFAISGPSAAQGNKDASAISIGDVQCSVTAFCLSPTASDSALASTASSPSASDSLLASTASSPSASGPALASLGSSALSGPSNTLLPTASRSLFPPGLRPTSSVASIETPPQSAGESSNNSNNSNTVALAVSLTAVATIVLCLLILLMHRKREWFKGVLMKKSTSSQAAPSNNHWDQDGANSPDDAEEGASSVSTDFLVASASYPGSYRNGPFLLHPPPVQQTQTYPSFTPTSPHPIFQPQQALDIRNSSTRSSFNNLQSNSYHNGAALSVRHLSLDRNNQSRIGDPVGQNLTTRHQSLERPNHMNRWTGPNGPTPFLHLPSSLVREGHEPSYASGEGDDLQSDMDEVTSAGEHQHRKMDTAAVQPQHKGSFGNKPLLDFNAASPSALALPSSSPSQALYEKPAHPTESAPHQGLKTPMLHAGPALPHASPHTPLAPGLAPPSYTSALMFPPPLMSGVVPGVALAASSPSAGMHMPLMQMPVPPVPVAAVPADDGSRTVPQTSNEAIEFALLQRRMKKLADRERRRRVVSYGYGGDSSTEGSEYDEETNSSAEDGEDDEDDGDYLEDEDEEEALMFLQQQLRMQHAAGAGFGFGGLMNFVPGTTRVVGPDGFTGAANAATASNGGVAGLGDRFETDGDDLPLAAMALRALQESMKQKQI